VYIYLSNEEEAPLDVFFDDLQITHQLGPVVQANDYYPFGMTFNSYQRENSTANNFLYNGKELQSELDLGWLDYGARMYDASLSRFMTIDPKTEIYNNWSPYVYAGNDPIRYEDLNGEGPWDKVKGILAAFLDNATGGLFNIRGSMAPKNPTSQQASDFNQGLDMGDVSSMLIGGAMLDGGSAAAAGGAAVLLGTAGTTAPVSGTVAAAGAAIAIEGTIMAAGGVTNFASQKG
jgi:RHS repeat-associated protein